MKKLLAVIFAAALAVGFYFAWESGLVKRLSDYDELVQTMRRSGLQGPLICIGIQFVQVVVFMIPGEITQIAAGYVFGAWFGFVYSVIGIMLGSAFNYLFARVVGRPVIEKFLGAGTLARIDHALETRRGQSALFLLFLLPGLPKDAMSYGAGLTSITLPQFVTISGLARMPALLFSTLIGSQLYERDYGALAVTVVVGALVILGFYLYEKRRNRNDSPHDA